MSALDLTSPRVWVLQDHQGQRLTSDTYSDYHAAIAAGRALGSLWPVYAVWVLA